MAERIYIFKYRCFLKFEMFILLSFWFDRFFLLVCHGGSPLWFPAVVPRSIVARPGDAPPPKDWWHPCSLRCYTNARARVGGYLISKVSGRMLR